MNQIDVNRYVSGSGARCPYCQGDYIRGGRFDMDGGGITQIISCVDCKKHWSDIYALVGVYDHKTEISRTAEKPRKTFYYVILVWEDVEPESFGPFATKVLRDNEAKRLREVAGYESGVYAMDIKALEAPEMVAVYSYSHGFFADEQEEV